MLYALLGPGCLQTHMIRAEQGEVATALWSNGHFSTVRGIREGQYGFGFVAHYEKSNLPYVIEGTAFYRELLNTFVQMCRTRTPPLDYDIMREVISFVSAADASASRDGQPVSLD